MVGIVKAAPGIPQNILNADTRNDHRSGCTPSETHFRSNGPVSKPLNVSRRPGENAGRQQVGIYSSKQSEKDVKVTVVEVSGSDDENFKKIVMKSPDPKIIYEPAQSTAPISRIAYVTHHDNQLKLKMMQKKIQKYAEDSEVSQPISFRATTLTEKTGKGEKLVLDHIKELLAGNDLVILESNLGFNGDGFAYTPELFDGTTAKVLFFDGGGGKYSKVNAGVEELKSHLGERMLANTSYDHKDLVPALGNENLLGAILQKPK